jgi:hypothetical protein
MHYGYVVAVVAVIEVVAVVVVLLLVVVVAVAPAALSHKSPEWPGGPLLPIWSAGPIFRALHTLLHPPCCSGNVKAITGSFNLRPAYIFPGLSNKIYKTRPENWFCQKTGNITHVNSIVPNPN